MSSLRLRLFAILVAATGLVWFAAVVWTYVDSRSRFEGILDRRLMEAARMVDSLFASVRPARDAPDAAASGAAFAAVGYDRHLSCQIWSLDGRLVGASGGAPDPALTERDEGFSDRSIDGRRWRVFALVDRAKGYRVLVGDNLEQRRDLEWGFVGGLLLTAAGVLPILALIIWLSIGRGLRPLAAITGALAGRDAELLDPLDVGRTPPEIRPLVDALNRLFGKAAAARDHERSFLAYAAHELRTPLAGLKTQVQVAMGAPTAAMHDAALAKTLLAVDRSTRLVGQLLAMSRLDSSVFSVAPCWLAVEERLRDLLAGMDRSQAPERIVFSNELASLELRMDEQLFDLAARNLMENALTMTPRDGVVRWGASLDADGAGALWLEDSGPGIAEAERELVTRRFVRGSRRAAVGSGLGLAIVTAALDRSGAVLRLGSGPSGCGLKADLVFGRGAFRAATASIPLCLGRPPSATTLVQLQ